ncbi:hypothetical protein CAPTEDRAFT_218781 [Capitella teleta]|uniref:Tubulin/FtsZ 2-layer sandwich domain-containing protein n=1 Tax=Capitella teleta TaxID=283909 RepID=R7T5N1_CAPTE|nr:hypothetical protein CAPTEDRAFT_218781 [Capitella teleta]|eukprot:ELT88580.1 hypothetical protein CAPTEDRAFT_218781 [Capitella teleta]
MAICKQLRTGSGLGTYVLNLLQDEYPEVYRFVTAVYPSGEDDVITSPYNSVLAMRQLTENADCVLPVENQALVDIVNKITQSLPPDKFGKRTFGASSGLTGSRVKADSVLTTSEGGVTKEKDEKPFDTMNNIVANMLLNLTSSARFEGSMNVDLNEITMNLVPFPRLHYLVSSQTPLYALADMKIPARRLDQMFTDAFHHENQLMSVDPKHSLYLACALMVRGNVQVSDIRRNIERLRPNLKFIHWNDEGWKTGLCSVAPVGHPYSLLTLANNTAVKHSFNDLKGRYVKLYKRKAHTHHYTSEEGMEVSDFDQSLESLNSLIYEYEALDQQSLQPPPCVPRLNVVS